MGARSRFLIKITLAVAAASVLLPSMALVYFISDNPFEFAVEECDRPDTESWLDVVLQGCIDPQYALEFVGLYGLVIFLGLAGVVGLLRVGDLWAAD